MPKSTKINSTTPWLNLHIYPKPDCRSACAFNSASMKSNSSQQHSLKCNSICSPIINIYPRRVGPIPNVATFTGKMRLFLDHHLGGESPSSELSVSVDSSSASMVENAGLKNLSMTSCRSALSGNRPPCISFITNLSATCVRNVRCA